MILTGVPSSTAPQTLAGSGYGSTSVGLVVIWQILW
jgi:hypothetical protein